MRFFLLYVTKNIVILLNYCVYNTCVCVCGNGRCQQQQQMKKRRRNRNEVNYQEQPHQTDNNIKYEERRRRRRKNNTKKHGQNEEHWNSILWCVRDTIASWTRNEKNSNELTFSSKVFSRNTQHSLAHSVYRIYYAIWMWMICVCRV